MRTWLPRLASWVVAGTVLTAAGVAQFAVAPLAASCLSGGDARVCETIGVVVLNVSGIACLLIGLTFLAVGAASSVRHNISV